MAQCKAKSKQSGDRCKNRAVRGLDVCHIHGGKTPKGIASPQTEHGRYSRHLPTRIAARYEQAASDGELLNLRHDIALVEARLIDVLDRVDSGESGRLWSELYASWEAFKRARALGKTDEMAEALHAHEQLLARGVSDYAAWHEVGALLDQKRKLAESERKRLVEMQQTITTEQALLFVSAVMDSVRRNVDDRNALAAISRDLERASLSGGIPADSSGRA